jgi:hypothetical protein
MVLHRPEWLLSLKNQLFSLFTCVLSVFLNSFCHLFQFMLAESQMSQSRVIKNPFIISKPLTEDPQAAPTTSAARGGRGGRNDSAGRGRARRDNSAAEP